MSRSGVRLVYYELSDFLDRLGSWAILLFDMYKEEVANGVFQRHVLRVYGIDGSGNVVVYEDSRAVKPWDEASVKTLYEEWMSIVEKLGARPGRIEG